MSNKVKSLTNSLSHPCCWKYDNGQWQLNCMDAVNTIIVGQPKPCFQSFEGLWYRRQFHDKSVQNLLIVLWNISTFFLWKCVILRGFPVDRKLFNSQKIISKLGGNKNYILGKKGDLFSLIFAVCHWPTSCSTPAASLDQNFCNCLNSSVNIKCTWSSKKVRSTFTTPKFLNRSLRKW